VLMQLDPGADRPDFGATVTVQIADSGAMVQRVARLVGGRDWVRTGATELGLDCLRRHLFGLPVDERIDFERR
jgi:nicotinamide-nucleotide amidase